jgi:hypothetical protein
MTMADTITIVIHPHGLKNLYRVTRSMTRAEEVPDGASICRSPRHWFSPKKKRTGRAARPLFQTLV